MRSNEYERSNRIGDGLRTVGGEGGGGGREGRNRVKKGEGRAECYQSTISRSQQHGLQGRGQHEVETGAGRMRTYITVPPFRKTLICGHVAPQSSAVM